METEMTTPRAAGMTAALRLEALTIAWMVVEAVASVGAGLAAKSLLLVAFGVDSVIELVSAGMLYRRLSLEMRAAPGDGAAFEGAERRAARIGGTLLFVLAAYVLLQSSYGLLHRRAAEESWWGIGITAVAALGMPVIARRKLRIAEEIGSRALRADAIESLTCGTLAGLTLAGLLANALLRWWWLDSVAALVLVPFLVREGREAIKDECGCC